MRMLLLMLLLPLPLTASASGTKMATMTTTATTTTTIPNDVHCFTSQVYENLLLQMFETFSAKAIGLFLRDFNGSSKGFGFRPCLGFHGSGICA